MVDPVALGAAQARQTRQAQYAALGLGLGAGVGDVRAAYRRLARELHPDVNRAPDAAERMRVINAAHAALTAGPLSLDVAAPAPQASAPQQGPGSAPRYTASAPRSAGAPAWYRHAASVPGAGDVGSVVGAAALGGSHYAPATIAGVFGLCALVAVFAAWAFVVARPFQGIAPVAALATESRSAASAAPSVSTQATRSAGASAATQATQASANAAANAAAARANAAGLGAATVAPAARESQATQPVQPAQTTKPIQTVVPAGSGVLAAVDTRQPTASDSRGGALPAAKTMAVAPAPAEANAPVVSVEAPAPAAQPVQQAVRPQTAQTTVPLLLVAPAPQAGTTQPAQHIQAVSARPAADGAAVAAAATRALSGYDKAWTNYAGALRAAAAGGLLQAAAGAAPRNVSLASASGGAGAVAFLSGDAQVTLARSLHFQQQVAWNQQASAVLVSAPQDAARPDGAKAARAELRLRQAAELVARAQESGAAVPAAQVKPLLDEAEALHREVVAEWAALLRMVG